MNTEFAKNIKQLIADFIEKIFDSILHLGRTCLPNGHQKAPCTLLTSFAHQDLVCLPCQKPELLFQW